jgi:hypothetical protein
MLVLGGAVLGQLHYLASVEVGLVVALAIDVPSLIYASIQFREATVQIESAARTAHGLTQVRDVQDALASTTDRLMKGVSDLANDIARL